MTGAIVVIAVQLVFALLITPLLIGLNIRNKCQFGGIRITGLDRGRVC